MSKKEPLKIETTKENKKIFFGENGEIIDKPEQKEEKQNDKIKKSKNKINDIETKWFQLYDEYNTKELSEIKESELKTFEEHCRKCFNEEIEKLEKNNPSDAKWLQTALNKGTTKDRANAGALLVQSNPLPNLSALDSLITLTKFSNKNSSDIFETVTNLFKNLLPSHRKLIPLDQRGNDWKNLKKMTVDMATRNQIYAHWYYENELKGRFNVYLQSLQGSLQNGKEINKIKAIISASNLLKTCPEREAYILNIIVNKFGDPDKKIASKATYNLRQILLTHPNMAHVMILETEKLIFRKNINDLAQHYGIGFLSLIAPIANAQSSQKLVDICFSFFKIKIEKGDINSKTMQSILNCIRIAIQNINDFNEDKKKIEITTPDVVNTIYRLIYLSNISISFQALSLLLQLVLVQNESHDRFYNALYRKMLDPEIFGANNKITSLYFHIIHRSVHQDSNVPRCKAFIKRLLQMSLSFSSAKACGALIVINKLLKSRPELKSFYLQEITVKPEIKTDKINNRKIEAMSDDEDEQYKDVEIDGKVIEHEKIKESVTSSWIHVKNTTKQKEETSSHIKVPTKYDPFKRSAAYSGAEFTLFYELILMSKYFHPTVQVFVENILKNQKINYYGDPLKDFSISHFLERFAFKNPKKTDPNEEKSAFNNNYQAKGSRGLSVHSLTEQSCTEDERFIFDFIQRKREIREKHIKLSENEEDVDDLESVDDDEFDSYLDTLGAKADFDKSEKDFDYLSEIKNESGKKEAIKGKNKKGQQDDEESLMDDDWEDDFDGSEGSGDMDGSDFGDESGTDQSIEEDLGSMDDMSDSNDDELDETAPKSMKKASKKQSKREEKGLNNLFVAVDDFSEMIEKNSSKHGTLGEIFNKDKSSQKQLDWEDKRHNRPSGFKRKNASGKSGKFPFKKKFKK